MKKFADRRPVLQQATDPEVRDLARWEETDPDTWPAEWADEPIGFIPTGGISGLDGANGPGYDTAVGPRMTRRHFCSRMATMTTALAIAPIASSRSLTGSGSAGPLERAYHRVLDSRDEVNRSAAWVRSQTYNFEESGAIEGRTWAAQCAESRAVADLVREIALTAGVELEAPPADWDAATDLPFRPVAVAVEGDSVYMLMAEDTRYYTAHSDEGVASRFRPVVSRIRSRE